MIRGISGLICLLFLTASCALAQTSTVGQVRHAPTLNGSVDGSIQQMTAENTTLNGGAAVTGDLLIPGTPTVQLNGNPTYGGTLDGTGAAVPTSHKVTLNGGASLRHVARRTDAVTLPMVVTPPQPAGTRSVSLNHSAESPGDFATLKHLTLNSNVGQIVVPAGTYGNFTANSGSGFTIGVTGATTPAVYNFQNLTLNSNSTFTVLGPVVVTINGGFSTNGPMGAAAHPEWLKLRIAGGGLSLNGSVLVYAQLEAPDGTLTLNGSSRFIGAIAVDRLTVNGNSLLQLVAAGTSNQPPVVALTAPANGASFLAPAAISLAATASDSDGSVARVEFYAGATLLGTDTSVPYTLSLTGVGAGTYTYSARAIDNQGSSSESASVTVTVTSPNVPPTVTLTAPADGTLYTSPVTLSLTASAADADGSIAKVEFYQGTTKLGEDSSSPYSISTGSLTPGVYGFSAKAFDNLGAITTSSTVTITVVPPNQGPVVSLTSPSDGSSFVAPAAFNLLASATDPDGSIAKVEFYQGSTKIGEDSFSPFQFAVSSLAPGSYNYLARAIDNTGAATDSAPITITVTGPNVPPTVALTGPADGATFLAPANITLTATATDSNGTVAKVEFFNGSTKLGEDLTAPYEFAWSGVAAGSYTVTAVATDNDGASTTSVARTISVAAGNGVPFVANFEPAEGYTIGALQGQKGWTVQGAASVVASPRYSGQQAVAVAPATPVSQLNHDFLTSISGVTFVDIFARPAAAPLPADGVFLSTDVAKVALTGSGLTGVLQVFKGDGAGGGTWVTTATALALDTTGRTADWMRLTIRADYAGKRWDLYCNGHMVAADLGFISNSQATISSLGLRGHLTSEVGYDDLLVSFENPLFIDADKDGMDDAWESAHGLNPAVNDRDGDLDGDGISNLREYLLGTHPNLADTDGDGMSDGYEIGHGLNPTQADSAEDSDHDGLTNLQEYQMGTNAGNIDTDGDGIPDALEVALGYDPLHLQLGISFDSDEDGDGLTLAQELLLGTNPHVADDLRAGPDSDGDGLSDRWEMAHGMNPLAGETAAALDADVDNDGLSLVQEAQAGTNPNLADTDGDGIPDGYEVAHGLNPLVNDSALDPDGDGLTNQQEYQRGSDPADYYNGMDHEILPFIGGDFDLGAGNVLAVRVTDRNGTPLVNAPVTFEVNEGNSQIALTPDGPSLGQSAEVRSGPGGIARVYLKSAP